MTEQVMELVSQLCSPTESEAVLELLCTNACQWLDGLLADGVTAEDCGGAYPLAAAWLVMDWLNSGRNWEGVTSLTAGDMKVTRDGGAQDGGLSGKAMELMGPYLRDRSFVFRGVRG